MNKNIMNLKKTIKSMKHLPIILIVSLYFSCVLYLTLFNTFVYIWIIPFLTIGMIWALEKIFYQIKPIKIEYQQCHFKSYKIFIGVFLIVFIGEVIYWMAYYPGGFNLDAYGQWDQVHGLMQWNNWHPVLTTFIYWCLTRFVDKLAFCIFVQLVLFAIAISMVFTELYKYGLNKKIIWIFSIVIALNPAITMNNVCLIKDVPFTICTIMLFWYTLRAFFSKGEYITSIRGKCVLLIILTSMMLIRHNAVFLAVTYSLSLAFVYRDKFKTTLGLFGISVGIIVLVESLLFPIIGVEQHSNFTGEVVGIPMSVMGNALVNNYENVPEDVKIFMENIANKEEWDEHYVVGEWDSCKWEFGGIYLLQNEPLNKILKLSFDTAKSCPEEAYRSLRENTRVVWQVIGKNDWNTWIYIEENDYGIEEEPNEICQRLVYKIIDVSNTCIGSMLSWNTGVWIVIFMLSFLVFIFWRVNHLLPIIIGTLAYDFLTMCLLCGPSFRYFYFNIVLIFPLIATIMVIYTYKKREHKDLETKDEI